ncbi:MAG: zinc ABC transporter substrate-binding protein [Alphaproteobacteria bacterium]|nr:zinc ABC transporter substrate-binding protein [Alphaproteobacteria bacterium]
MKKIIFTFLCLLSLNAYADLKVVTDFPPIHSLTAMVMEGVGRPYLIFQSDKNFSHHKLEITSSEMKRLKKADVVFWIGEEMTPNLRKAMAKAAPRAQSIELLNSSGLELLPVGENPLQNKEQKNDVHIWMNPENAKILLRRISGILGQRDPENAGKYRANARKWEKEIDTLKKYVLPENGNKPLLVTLHDGYPYLFKYLDLRNTHAMNVHAEYIAGPVTWKKIRQEISDMHPKCVISDPSLKKTEAKNMKKIKKARVIELDVMGSKFKPNPRLYFNLMEHTISTINKCLE